VRGNTDVPRLFERVCAVRRIWIRRHEIEGFCLSGVQYGNG
jgi:hypothetical protein